MSIVASKRFRVALVCLLVLCLSPTAMMTPWLDALLDSRFDSKPVLIISAFSGSAASVLASRTRGRLSDGLDDLLKAALVNGRPSIVFARKSRPSFFEENTGIFHGIDSMVVPVRAPPVLHCIIL